MFPYFQQIYIAALLVTLKESTPEPINENNLNIFIKYKESI